MKYIIFIFIILVAYVLSITSMKYIKQKKIADFIFAFLIFALYVAHSFIIFRDVGFYDWNYQNTLPTANVSPFMFVLTPIILVFPKAIKPYFFLLISLLSFGMLSSAILGCAFNAFRNYAFHYHFAMDYTAHIIISLFGIYLVKTEQVKPTPKKCLISSLIIFAVATLMLILNAIFDTAFFGLSLSGKHTIYNSVIVENSYLSALIYFTGLATVLFLGYLYIKIINKKSDVLYEKQQFT